MKKMSRLLFVSGAALLLAACGDTQPEEPDMPSEEDTTEEVDPTEPDETTESTEVEPVTVSMLNNEGEEAGTAVFEEDEDGVTVTLSLEGIPAGEYGMHIHEFGLATPPDFEDAGSHFNPTDVEHGVNSDTGPHIGDLPNLEVSEDGIVNEVIQIPDATLQPGEENTLNTEDGTSLIVHTEADDYESQPTGDAGDRMLGGVIFPAE